MKRYCFALDLKNDENLIAEYEYWHKDENGWPEIRQSILDANVMDMEIYRTANRLFMIMDVSDDFSLEQKSEMDLKNSKVREWENFMSKFQQSLTWAQEGEKWVEMKKIYKLKKLQKFEDKKL